MIAIHRAERIDPETGTREIAEFFGPHELKMFGCAYVPPEPPVGGVVICPSLHAEFAHNYRREVLLARSLAGHRVAVQRFHYRGIGNSDGDGSEASFETMSIDAVDAARWLQERTGVSRLAFVGPRLGAFVAAAASSRFDRAPLVLWAPLTNAVDYFREAFRAQAIRDLKDGVARRPPGGDITRQLEETGSVDVLGYTVDRGVYASSIGRTLREAVGDQPRPVFLVQIDRASDLSRQNEKMVTNWRNQGFAVDTSVLRSEESWWLTVPIPGGEEARPITKELVEVTTTWLDRQLIERGIDDRSNGNH
jgi:alpha-beta hydrolase superfamily lysophospholipase